MSNYNVKKLAEFFKQKKEKGEHFILFTGAGCSKSAGIPLASDLVNEINRDYKLYIEPLSEEDKKDYGKCMEALDKQSRRTLLKKYIENAKINWSHIVQAQLMKEEYISYVLTFNFDNLLSRSCGLLGMYPAIYDFTSSNIELHHFMADQAIVHLHGQHHGFVQINANKEAKNHAEQLGGFVVEMLNKHPSLFIGYSGKADAFFDILQDKFTGQHLLFWTDRSTEIPKHIDDSLIKKHKTAHYIQIDDADLFFIELARELGCFPPKIFENPYQHILDELEQIIEFPTLEKEDQRHIDTLSKVKSRLIHDVDQMLQANETDLETLFMKGEYQAIVDLYEADNTLANQSEIKKEIISLSYATLGNETSEKAISTKNEELFYKCFTQYEKSTNINPQYADIFYNWGTVLYELATLNKDESLFNESFTKFQKAADLNSKDEAIFYNWGIALSDLADLNQNQNLFHESFNKYKKAAEINPQDESIFVNWGITLFHLATLNQDKNLFYKSLAKYKKAAEINPKHNSVFYNWGNALSALAILTEDKNLLLESITKYQKAIEINQQNDKAFHNWGNALSALAILTEDKKLLLESFAKYQKATKINPQYDLAFNNWGSALSNLASLNKDEILFQEAYAKFQQSTDINPKSSSAFYKWGFALSELAELKKDKNLYKESCDKFEKVLMLNSANNEATEMWQKTLSELKKLDKGKIYRECLAKFNNFKNNIKSST